MPRTTHENAVYFIERRIFLGCDYIVFGEDEGGGGDREGYCCRMEECCKDAAVATIFGAGSVERGVAFKDRDTEGEVWHFVLRYIWAQVGMRFKVVVRKVLIFTESGRRDDGGCIIVNRKSTILIDKERYRSALTRTRSHWSKEPRDLARKGDFGFLSFFDSVFRKLLYCLGVLDDFKLFLFIRVLGS